MNVQIEARSKALAEGDSRALGVLEAESGGSLALPTLDLTDEDAADLRERVELDIKGLGADGVVAFGEQPSDEPRHQVSEVFESGPQQFEHELSEDLGHRTSSARR